MSVVGKPRSRWQGNQEQRKSLSFESQLIKMGTSDGCEPSLQANSSRSDTLSIWSPLAKRKRGVSDVFRSPRSRWSGQYQLGRALSGAAQKRRGKSTQKRLTESRWRAESVASSPGHHQSFRLPSRLRSPQSPVLKPIADNRQREYFVADAALTRSRALH